MPVCVRDIPAAAPIAPHHIAKMKRGSRMALGAVYSTSSTSTGWWCCQPAEDTVVDEPEGDDGGAQRMDAEVRLGRGMHGARRSGAQLAEDGAGGCIRSISKVVLPSFSSNVLHIYISPSKDGCNMVGIGALMKMIHNIKFRIGSC